MPPESQPLISVIVPAYNAAGFLPEALATVRAQHYAPLEIIIVDDGSTDGTRNLVSQWPEVRYLYQENQGPSAARNAGIDAARGDLLAFLDADDLWSADHLQRLLPPLASDPALHFVWGASRVVRLREGVDGIRSEETLHDSQCQFLIGSGLYRRSAFDVVGRFDPALKFAEDVDWIAAARQKNVPHLHVPHVVLVYRKHDGGMTNGRTFRDLNVMTALRRSIARHRGQQPGKVA